MGSKCSAGVQAQAKYKIFVGYFVGFYVDSVILPGITPDFTRKITECFPGCAGKGSKRAINVQQACRLGGVFSSILITPAL